MPRLSGRLLWPTLFAFLLFTVLLLAPVLFRAAEATAQNQPYFSPTFAASAKGSPYKDIYARTFGAGAPAPAPDGTDDAVPGGVVYVIEGGGLLTYRAEDYASGSGEAVTRAPLPPSDFTPGLPAPDASLPTIADKLYGAPPLDTAAGPVAEPIPLYPAPN